MKRKKTNWSRLICVLVTLISLTGCQKSSLTFTDVSELPYDENFNACSPVESINGQKIPHLLIQNDEIHYDGKVVHCNSTNQTITENEVLSLSYELDGRVFIKEIQFVKESEPKDEEVLLPQVPSNEEPEQVNEIEEPERNDEAQTEAPGENMVEDVPKVDEQPVQKPSEPQKPIEQSKPQGEVRKFLSSETVTNAQAREACVAYASKYSNFSSCVPLRDETTLIIGFIPE
ncbi:hypothetical protein [Erysipelothrix aquatica]|uniref:hypothetical protein n=1 Tax=Erysipelothrix aquatica TaxID=2683714 RepID=UPI00135B0869|nr:hypothetical protein [Erysipelothrix aquatica]